MRFSSPPKPKSLDAMTKLAIHTASGDLITAPVEAWIVALIASLPSEVALRVFKNVARLDGASLIPDKFLVTTDALGTVEVVERPVIDLGAR